MEGDLNSYLLTNLYTDSEKMVNLIELIGMLLQTKVYLFWTRNGEKPVPLYISLSSPLP